MSLTQLLGTTGAFALLLCTLEAGGARTDQELDKHALAATADDEASLEKLADYLARPCKSERDKARVIYRWITDRVAYNVKGFVSGEPGDNTTAGVLKSRKALCEGYANLFSDLSSRLGLKTARVEGHARGATHVAGQLVGASERHAWIAVFIQDEWRLCDPGWGAGIIEGMQFVKRFSNFFFMTPPEQLLFTHFPDDAKWQLVKPPLSVDEFNKRPKVGRHLFELGVTVKAIEMTVAEKGFRELVETFTHPSSATSIVQAPLTKHLTAGKEYEFKLKSSDLAEIAIFNEKTYVLLKRSGTLYSGKIKAQKGTLQISARKNKSDPLFAWVLGYVVE